MPDKVKFALVGAGGMGRQNAQRVTVDGRGEIVAICDSSGEAAERAAAELGVAELVSLAERFSDSGVDPTLPLVIAGYNGGEKAVRRWLALYPNPPEADHFAEDVGYTETRRYVRRVLGTLQAYRYIYGDEAGSPSGLQPANASDAAR